MKWYPQNKKDLGKILDKFLNQKINIKNKVHGIIVPHAGYEFSGEIAGKAFSLAKNIGAKKAIILSPSHYSPIQGVVTSDKEYWDTSLGQIKIIKSDFQKKSIENEHAIDNQIPFIQQLGFKEILPLMIGEITDKKAEEVAYKLKDLDGFFIFSTDFSHFLTYNEAVKKDNQTIKVIENLDFKNISKIDACGLFPLKILMYLCKIEGWKPKLIEYQNSGDITEEKDSVVGYASFYF